MKVRVSFVTSKGCVVEIDGDVSVSMQTSDSGGTQLVYGGFTGTVSISGGEGCPSVTATFKSGRVPAGKQLAVSVDHRRISELSKMTWRGNLAAVRILNDAGLNQKLIKAIKSKARATATKARV